MNRQKQCCGNKNRRHEKAGYACLVLLFAWPLLAVDDGDVSYVGGIVENLKERSPGKLDMTSQTELVFVFSFGLPRRSC